jgi:hypothetical protein
LSAQYRLVKGLQVTPGGTGVVSTASRADLALARESVVLIEASGFNRGRDLRNSLDDLASGLGR